MEANSPESRPHSGHLSAEEGLTMLQYWQPKRAILTHLCHEPDEKGGGDAGKFTHAELPEQLKRMCTAKGIDATLNKGQDNQYLEVHWSENKKTQLEIGYDGQRVQV
jgi:ribonuclease BN (tRNA processing enzyme)